MKPKTIKTSISNNSTFLKEFKKFALPIITIIALVFLCYRLIINITVAKIKTVLKSVKKASSNLHISTFNNNTGVCS